MAKDSYHHGNLKAALIAVGIDLLEEVGLEKLSLRAIAARAGVSHTAPKNHFGSFQGLLTAMAAEGFRRHADHMEQANADGTLDLLGAAEGYVAFARAHPNLYKLMFSWRMQKPDDPDLAVAGHRSYEILQEVVRRMGITDTASDEAVRAEALIWSIVHGYAQLTEGTAIRLDSTGARPSIRDVMSMMQLRTD